MNIFAQQEPAPRMMSLIFFAVGACLVTWAVIFERLVFRQARFCRISPGGESLAILGYYWRCCFFIIGSIVVFHLAQYFFRPENTASAGKTHSQTSIEHPLFNCCRRRIGRRLFCAVLSALWLRPIIEEMFFRVLLQGWLENVDRKWRRRCRRCGN